MIGICTRYSNHEATIAALRFADYCAIYGRDVSLFTMTQTPGKVDPNWDDKVHISTDLMFTEWARRCKAIIWTTTPHKAQVEWVNRHGIQTVLLFRMCEFDMSHKSVLRKFRRIFCPTTFSYIFLHNLGCRNLMQMHWEPGLPRFLKEAGHQITPKILVPLWDGNVYRTEMTLIEIIARSLHNHKNVEYTVAYSSSTIAPSALDKLRKLRKLWPDRLILKPGVPAHQRPMLFQDADLTLWTTHHESLNHVGLASMAMGTPVMGFEFPPTTEILEEDNSITVPVHVNIESLLPTVIPDYQSLEVLLDGVIREPKSLQSLQMDPNHRIGQRAYAFHEQMRRCFR